MATLPQTQIQADVASVFLSYFERAPEFQAMEWYAGLYTQLLADQGDNPAAGENAFKALSAQVYADGVANKEVPAGSSITNEWYVNYLYSNVLGREPDEDGLTYWTAQLNEGSIERAELVGLLLAAAQDDERDAAYVNNRTEVAVEFSQWENSNPQILDSLQYNAAEVLLGVNEDPATVAAAQEKLYSNQDGETFTLTTGADTGPDFTGTDADDVFNADFGPGLGGALTQQTLQGFDTLDGGEGNDTLNAELGGIDSLGGSYNPRISNIEQYNLTANNDGYLDLHRSSGYEEIWNKGSRADMTLDNLGEVATLGMDGVRDGAEFEVNYDNIAVETQKVVVNKSGAEGERVELEINGVLNGDITNLDLNVSNGVHLRLDNDAADIDNLTIAGDGILDLVGEDQFEFLQTLDTLGYDGDVTLDISGSGSLTSVLTGDGSDTITAAAANFSADTPPTTLDLGAGENRLILEDTFETQPEGTYTGGGLIDSAELSALNFTLAPVSNVQTLELVDVGLDDNASLTLDGVGGLETLVLRDFDADWGGGGGYDLSINGAPEVLTINATSAGDLNDADFDMEGGLLSVNGVVNLTMNAGDDLDINGGLMGDVLETLVLNAGDDAVLNASEGLDALTSIEVNALDTSTGTGGSSNATVDLTLAGVLGDDSELSALTTVNVTAVDNATLTLKGREGVEFVAGVQQIDEITINVTGVNQGGYTTQRTESAGNMLFTSGGIPGGFVDTTYSTWVPFWGTGNSSLHDAQAATDIASGLNGALGAILTANSTAGSNVVSVEWDGFETHEALAYFADASNATLGSQGAISTATVQPAATEVPMEAGEGFEALETIEVVAENGNADVKLTDVYGAFTLDVIAGDDADVHLVNTGATAVTVTAGMGTGDWAHVDVSGNTYGNQNLVSIKVTADTSDVNLADNVANLRMVDVSGVASNVAIDATLADFNQTAAGDAVVYMIGGTDVVTIASNAGAAEVFSFVGVDIGSVIIDNFEGGNGLHHDIIDVSALGITQISELTITDDGTDTTIDAGAFGGGIVELTGVLATDIDAGNFHFA